MFNYIFGIVTGVFLAFGGSKFYIFAKQALKDRRENELKKAEETMELMIDRIIRKKKE